MPHTKTELPHVFDVWETLERDIKAARYILLGFDFDGTLASIVAQPEHAQITDGNRKSLQELTQIEGVSAAVLSGRLLEDLRERVGVPGLILSGDHGFKIEFPDGKVHRPVPDTSVEGIDALQARLLTDTAHFAGVQLEPKEFSITVHYRRAAPGTAQLLKPLLDEMVAGTGFELKAGRMCWEIHLRVDWHKGRAFDWIAGQINAPGSGMFKLYAGDDQTDEDVFRTLHKRDWPMLILSSEKTGGTHARCQLESQEEVTILLNKLTQTLSYRCS